MRNVTIVFVLLVMVISGIVFTGYFSVKNEGGITSTEQDTKPSPTHGVTKKTGNFSEIGNLTQLNNQWSFVYEKPGSPALNEVLVFNKDSVCIYSNMKSPCNPSQLTMGERVRIDGNKEQNNIIVLSLTSEESGFIDDEIITEIKKSLSEKYNRPATSFVLSVTEKDSLHAKGTLRFTDELGGAIWFGALYQDKWVLASDGQGPMDCATASKYAFSTSMVPGCIDTTNGNTFIQR